jgi:hypothetical protein
MQDNIKVFMDHVGHTVVGEILESNGSRTKVKNPAILLASPNSNGQLSVQLVPVFFKEFIQLEKREEGSVFDYPSDKIVTSEIALEGRLTEQYVNMFQVAKKQETKEAPTIRLFDDQD